MGDHDGKANENVTLKSKLVQSVKSGGYIHISIYVVGSRPQAYKTRPKGNMGSH